MKWLGENSFRLILFIILTVDAYGYFGWKGLMIWTVIVFFINEQISFVVRKLKS